jgi:hypothetical protein
VSQGQFQLLGFFAAAVFKEVRIDFEFLPGSGSVASGRVGNLGGGRDLPESAVAQDLLDEPAWPPPWWALMKAMIFMVPPQRGQRSGSA